MNKFLAVFFIVAAYVASSLAAASSTNVANDAFDKRSKPSNVVVWQLGNGTGSATDTILVEGQNVFGPFNLSQNAARPQYRGFRATTISGTVASGDSVELAYQVINGSSIVDTTPIWTATDTIISTGKLGAFADLSSKPGQAIVFKLRNIDATGILIAKKVRIAAIATSTEYVDIQK